MNQKKKVVIIGAGFSGLSAALLLTKKHDIDVTIIDSDNDVGGLAGGFEKNGVLIEKFYHHWFASDSYINELVEEVDVKDDVVLRPTKTGMYYANNFYKLSSPLDLLKFSAISFVARIRLGVSVLAARAIKDWKKIEHITAYDWLKKLCGKEAFEVVWKPLLDGKFGPYAEKVGAVWFWKKITLRGGSRAKDGREVLQYFKGGFLKLARRVRDVVVERGGAVHLNELVKDVTKTGDTYVVETDQRVIEADSVLFTPAPSLVSKLGSSLFSEDYLEKLNRIQYLANLCIVLELNRSLSDIYWLNINDPDFPFVGIIEHTNFEAPEYYNGKHIVYLSKYLPKEDKLYSMTEAELTEYLIPFIIRMFPEFSKDWIESVSVWKADYAQPIMVPHYSQMVPARQSPEDGVFLVNMAQIYPEDRGTNYAVRDGFLVAEEIAEYLNNSE